ncbi:hypothetical protein EUTSA_v10026956mg [Eutrema salsugineum]|uniref:J domain-containing protein n=1 Tax=Eutrema salsugineum TaxID=72664 RepID=V4MIK7_EUTSA|nr:hypothetical protein EUTSA_v10026956mg [Eutrema salsugineum]
MGFLGSEVDGRGRECSDRGEWVVCRGRDAPDRGKMLVGRGWKCLPAGLRDILLLAYLLIKPLDCQSVKFTRKLILPSLRSPNLSWIRRPTSETSQSQKPSYRTTKTSSNLVDDPFVVLEESASTLREPSKGEFTDPLEEIGKFNSRKTDHSSVRGGELVDVDSLDGLRKSGPDMNSRGKSHLRPESISGSQSPVESSGNYHAKKVSSDEVLEPQNTSSRSVPQTSSPVYENKSVNSDGCFESSDDVWLTVSEILFTQPTSAPPPSRPPPPRPTRPIKKKVNEPSLSSSTNHSHLPNSARASAYSPTVSPMDELDAFSMGRNQTAANGHPESSSGEDPDVLTAAVASAAAMKDAMDKAEAKFRHAKERREKENLKGTKRKARDTRARLERHQRTQERAVCINRVVKSFSLMSFISEKDTKSTITFSNINTFLNQAKALAEKHERDLQVKRDQAERNKFYRKATLCIHPDKVQQKGANLQQKYIAEKVFDLLKEAWNKFNSEELF